MTRIAQPVSNLFQGAKRPPRRYVASNVTKFMPVEVLTDWDDQTYDCTPAINTAQALTGTAGRKAIKITHTATGSHMSIRSDAFAAKDLTSHTLLVRFYIHAGTGTANPLTLSSISLWMYDNAGKYAVKSIMDVAGVSAQVGATVDGWYSIPVCTSNFTYEGGFDVTNVVKFRFSVNVVAGETGTGSTAAVTLDSIEAIAPSGTASYVLRVDNTQGHLLQVAAYAQTKGVRMTCAINPYLVSTTAFNGEEATYLTATELRQLEQMGHFVCAYSGGDGVVMTTTWATKTLAERIQTLRNAREKFAAWGLSPMGAQCMCESGLSGIVASDYDLIAPYLSVFSAGPGFTLTPAAAATRSLSGAIPFPLLPDSLSVADGVTALDAGQLDSLFDDAIATKSVLLITGHCYSAGEKTALYALIDALVAKTGLTNVTLDQVATGGVL